MKNSSKEWKFLLLITVTNVLVASGYAIAGAVAPESILPEGAIPNQASSIFALYAAARTIPLAVLVIYCILTKNKIAIMVLGALAGFIQLFDVFVGLYQHDIMKSAGPLFLSVLQLSVLFWVWKKEENFTKE